MGKMLQAFGLQRRAEGDTSTGSSLPVPPSRSQSSAVPLNTAIGLTGVLRSIQILTIVGGSVEISTFRGGQRIDAVPLVATPDVDLTQKRFVKRTIASMACTGNAYWRKFRTPDGLVSSYRVLNPLAIRRDYDDAGRLIWRYRELRGTRLTEQVFSDRDVRQLKLLEIPGYDDGVGPIQAQRLALSGHIAVRSYASRWFDDSPVPTGVLKTENQLDRGSATAIREAFLDGIRDNGLAVLGHGADYTPVALNPEDAQWLQVQNFNLGEQARMFGVPAPYVDAPIEGSTMTYANLEQVDTKFVRTTMLGYFTEIEDALSADLVRGQTAKFDLPTLLRSDNFTRAKTQEIYLRNKVLTPAQVAHAEGIEYQGADQ